MPARDHIFECTSLWEIFIARLWNQSSYILPRKMKWGAQSLHTVWRHLYLECHIHKPQDYFLLLRGVLHVFPPFPLSRHCFFFSVQHFPSKLSLMCKHFRPSYVVVSSATSLRKMIMITLGRKHLFPFWAEGPCDFLILDKPPYYFFLPYYSCLWQEQAFLSVWRPETMLHIIFMSNSSLVLALNSKTVFLEIWSVALLHPSQTRLKSPCTYRFPQLLFRIDSMSVLPVTCSAL